MLPRMCRLPETLRVAGPLSDDLQCPRAAERSACCGNSQKSVEAPSEVRPQPALTGIAGYLGLSCAEGIWVSGYL